MIIPSNICMRVYVYLREIAGSRVLNCDGSHQAALQTLYHFIPHQSCDYVHLATLLQKDHQSLIFAKTTAVPTIYILIA